MKEQGTEGKEDEEQGVSECNIQTSQEFIWCS